MEPKRGSAASFDSLEKPNKHLSTGSNREIAGKPALKLFESPLTHERAAAPLPPPRAPVLNISGPNHFSNKIRENIYDDRTDDPESDNDANEVPMRETPEFRRFEEAQNIELFYDLFFVANLTTFTDVHDINDVAQLKAYAGFFCILWFLWCQVILFDVRFVQDSILERIGKACQFGVMIGLAVVGPDFNPSDQVAGVFQSLAIILALSRIILASQYIAMLYLVWHYKETKKPLMLIAGSHTIAGLIYFATFFGFKSDNPQGHVFIVWYVTAVLETAVNVALSAKWKVLSFEETHLIKRMTLLTLIILGEGIIGLSKSIATIGAIEEKWNPALIITIISGVAIIYFIYMIYFDWMNHKHFGSLREGLWTFSHFPFHLALVLLLEGAAQFVIWRKAIETTNGASIKYLEATKDFTGNSMTLSTIYSNVTNQIFERFPPKFAHTIRNAEESIRGIGNTTLDSPEQRKDIGTLFATVQDSLFRKFEIEPPEPISKNAPALEDPNDEWNSQLKVFKLVFIYFFIAAGATLLLMNILNFLSLRKKNKGDYSRITINSVVGAVLLSLAGIVNTEAGFLFVKSAFILPTVAGAFIIVMLLGYTKV